MALAIARASRNISVRSKDRLPLDESQLALKLPLGPPPQRPDRLLQQLGRRVLKMTDCTSPTTTAPSGKYTTRLSHRWQIQTHKIEKKITQTIPCVGRVACTCTSKH